MLSDVLVKAPGLYRYKSYNDLNNLNRNLFYLFFNVFVYYNFMKINSTINIVEI